MAQKPSIGRIVQYKLSEADVDKIVRRRSDAEKHYHPATGVHVTGHGEQRHVGNTPRPGDVYPMMIVRVWTEEIVNGQVFLDGNDVLWVTSVCEGDEPSNFAWPQVAPARALVDEQARTAAAHAQSAAHAAQFTADGAKTVAQHALDVANG